MSGELEGIVVIMTFFILLLVIAVYYDHTKAIKKLNEKIDKIMKHLKIE